MPKKPKSYLQASMHTIPAKSILSAYRENGWFGTNYTANLYRGCSHNCIYCDSRSICYRIDDFTTVRAKENALTTLEREFSAKKKKGTVITGAMSDPYNPQEKTMELTRGFLRLCSRYRFGVVALTKSDLVCRDIDLFAAVGEHSPSAVNITITTGDDALATLIEPRAPPSSDRFRAIEKLSLENILCGVILLPTLPFITDTKENVTGVVERAAEAGAAWVYAEKNFAVSLRDRQRAYFYERLDEHFPGLRNQYEKIYGDSYWCCSQEPDLWETFAETCEKCGVLFRHDEIDARISGKKKDVQSRLWQ